MIIWSKISLITLLAVNFTGEISTLEPHSQPLSLVKRREWKSNLIKAENLFQEASKYYHANQLATAIDLWQQALYIYLRLDDEKSTLITLKNLIAVSQ
ncbi:MAG: hypothetical protein MJK14_26165 [Rivularia sp. ALOHA_DT_140]|nr:hypothetical protein [Rivularia sp. ALOHA_DT_140]